MSDGTKNRPVDPPELRSAIRKAYVRSLPLLFVCYIIAYIDRTNISVAQLTMANSLPDFTKAVLGFGSGIFFLGYFLLEIPGTLIVERWSARKWICRIMVTWGIVAALTAFVKTPFQFYSIRFLLGLAEAGFFPGVIVYLTHWFPQRDRARALSYFLVASPIAMIVGNYVSGMMLDIGEDGAPTVLGMRGWQCIFVFWGIPAVLLGFYVLLALTDRPHQARWLTAGERQALENKLAQEHAAHQSAHHTSILKGLTNPNVLLLALAYFGVVTGNYGIEMFLPSILEDWYGLGSTTVTRLAMIPSCFVILGQLLIGWSSDHFNERRWHAILPIIFGASGLILATLTQGNLFLTVLCFTISAAGMKSYMPAFWSLPNVYLTAAAAAGSIGLINSVGNLGGHLGPTIVGKIKTLTGSYDIALYFLATTCLISSGVIFAMPWIYKRLASLNGTNGKLQAFGALALIVGCVYLGLTFWINRQLAPWGLLKDQALAAGMAPQAQLDQMATALEDWFARRPRIRDALVFRLDDLQRGCEQTIKAPPVQLDASARAHLQKTLSAAIQQIDGLKEELAKKVKEDKRHSHYAMPVATGLEEADKLVRQLQTTLRAPGS